MMHRWDVNCQMPIDLFARSLFAEQAEIMTGVLGWDEKRTQEEMDLPLELDGTVDFANPIPASKLARLHFTHS